MDDAPQPPAGMQATERELWKQAVSSRPSAEWSPADCILLAIYVRAWADVKRLDAEIAKHGEIEDGKVSPRFRVRAMREKALLDTAQKLRLCPASRYTAKDVGRLHRHATSARNAQATIDSDDLLQGIPKWKQ